MSCFTALCFLRFYFTLSQAPTNWMNAPKKSKDTAFLILFFLFCPHNWIEEWNVHALLCGNISSPKYLSKLLKMTWSNRHHMENPQKPKQVQTLKLRSAAWLLLAHPLLHISAHFLEVKLMVCHQNTKPACTVMKMPHPWSKIPPFTVFCHNNNNRALIVLHDVVHSWTW